jgi:hypothetical protein
MGFMKKAGQAAGGVFGGPVGSFVGGALGGIADSAVSGDSPIGGLMSSGLSALTGGIPGVGDAAQAAIPAATGESLLSTVTPSPTSLMDVLKSRSQSKYFRGL